MAMASSTYSYIYNISATPLDLCSLLPQRESKSTGSQASEMTMGSADLGDLIEKGGGAGFERRYLSTCYNDQSFSS